jgi:hypothetical protein
MSPGSSGGALGPMLRGEIDVPGRRAADVRGLIYRRSPCSAIEFQEEEALLTSVVGAEHQPVRLWVGRKPVRRKSAR